MKFDYMLSKSLGIHTDPANSFDTPNAFKPEIWAQEGLMILEKNLVATNLVHRDFSNTLASFGDTVNARKIGTFTAKRKTDSDEVTVQSATATTIPVILNQHLHTTFVIKDGEQTLAFRDLVSEYLEPAVKSIAQLMDEVVLCQVYQYLANHSGKLGTTPSWSSLVDLKETFNTNKVPQAGRNLIITPNTEGDLLNADDMAFVNAHTRGDDGTSMREGHLGRLAGFDTFMCQNTPSIATGNTTDAALVDLVAGYAVGSTSIAYDGASATPTPGSWCTIGGDMIPQRITAASATVLTISPGLSYAVLDDAAITIYVPGAVNYASDYDADYVKSLVVDGFTVAPKIGQLTSFGAAATSVYGATSTPTTTALDLCRPLYADISDDDAIGIGPMGEYNFGFHKNALALVIRPLATPPEGTGAKVYTASYNDLALRISMQYEARSQGLLVTVDTLCGVKTLDADLGAVLFG